jgi:hypothetical protein
MFGLRPSPPHWRSVLVFTPAWEQCTPSLGRNRKWGDWIASLLTYSLGFWACVGYRSPGIACKTVEHGVFRSWDCVRRGNAHTFQASPWKKCIWWRQLKAAFRYAFGWKANPQSPVVNYIVKLDARWSTAPLSLFISYWTFSRYESAHRNFRGMGVKVPRSASLAAVALGRVSR